MQTKINLKSADHHNYDSSADFIYQYTILLCAYSFYNELPDNWRKFLNNQDSEGKRKGLTSLYTMLKNNDMRVAEDALAFALSNGVKDADSILAAYRTLTSKVQQMQPMQLECNILQMPSFKIDNSRYDNLFNKEALINEG